MRSTLVLGLAVMLAGCITVPENAFVLTPERLEQRQVETRRYDGIKEESLLIASSNALQDMGFNLENSETKLGVLTASKQRDAVNGGEVAAAVLVALLGGGVMPISKDQTIRVALVVRAISDSNGKPMSENQLVRITFQRMVRRTDNSVYAETLKDPQLYQAFFERVSKSVFLEAQKI